MKVRNLPWLALFALAACNNDADQPEGAPTAVETAEPAPAEPEPEPAPTAAPTAIPAAIQGRWGLTEADCEPGRPDAKGLLTITAGKLEFYESVATLDGIDEASETRIRADFDFEGEGMTWEREIVLDVQDGGRTLIRREYGEDAAPDPFRYSQCN